MITEVQPFVFDDTSVNYLSFSGNPLRKLYSYSFNSLSVSNTFNLAGLQFTTIPTRAFYDVTAQYLYLDSGKISQIEEEAFYDVRVSQDM